MSSLASLVDYHVHTQRCGHAEGSMEQYIAHARAIGLGEIGFSDHLPLYWLPQEQRDPELAMPEHQLSEYVAAVRQFQEEQAEVRIRLAVEVDYIPGWDSHLAELLGREAWDYLLGSVHFIGEWGFDDPRYVAGYDQWDLDALYETYFDLVLGAAETGLFDVIAHLDLPKKFGHRPTRAPAPLYEHVAARLQRADVCVEVSSAGLRKPVGELYPAPELLRACHRAGVPATLASDAHRPHEVGLDFDRSLALLREVGYTEVAAFESRHRTFRRLP